MAVPTNPPYCLHHCSLQGHFNIQGSPPGLHTHACICHALLQHADLSEAHRQKYHRSHLVITQEAQYNHLLPKITMPHNHRVSLRPSHGAPFPSGSGRKLPIRGYDLSQDTRGQPSVQQLGPCQTSQTEVPSCHTKQNKHLSLNTGRRSLSLPTAQGRCPA